MGVLAPFLFRSLVAKMQNCTVLGTFAWPFLRRPRLGGARRGADLCLPEAGETSRSPSDGRTPQPCFFRSEETCILFL